MLEQRHREKVKNLRETEAHRRDKILREERELFKREREKIMKYIKRGYGEDKEIIMRGYGVNSEWIKR